MTLRLLHASDLHLGRRFGSLPEPVRGRLVEARHGAIARLAAAARAAGAADVLVAGDVFDTETPSDAVRRQALAAMGAEPGLTWWMLPGNHDSLAAEALWDRVMHEAPANVRPLLTPAPVEIAPGAVLLPAPPPHRRPGRDLTVAMEAPTPDGALRIGLAHGGVVDFDAEDGGAGAIPPDRDRLSGLDYLALGDWHGQRRISDRTWYSGTPEQDRFKHAVRGAALAVTLTPGAPPQVDRVETGAFLWSELTLDLLPGDDAVAMLEAALPGAARRDILVRVAARGRLRLEARAALRHAAIRAAPEFWHFEIDEAALVTEHDAGDLDSIAPGGALRLAAAALQAEARDAALSEGDRAVASAALSRLHALLTGEAR